jgi:hypothetical protein
MAAAAKTSSGDQPSGRRMPRRGAVKLIWYKVIGQPEEAIARSCDVSAGGIGLHTTHPVATGEEVFVEVITASGAVSFLGRVMHCRQQGEYHRVGLKIEAMPPNDRSPWKKLVDEGK